MTNQLSARPTHRERHKTADAARQDEAAKDKAAAQGRDQLERGRDLFRQRQTARAGLDAVAASMPMDQAPTPQERQTRIESADDEQRAELMVGVLEKNVRKLEAEHGAARLEVAKRNQDVEESAICVLVEEAHASIQRLADAMAALKKTDSEVKAVVGALIQLKRFREAEQLNNKCASLKWPDVQPNIARALDFLRRLQSDPDAEWLS